MLIEPVQERIVQIRASWWKTFTFGLGQFVRLKRAAL